MPHSSHPLKTSYFLNCPQSVLSSDCRWSVTTATTNMRNDGLVLLGEAEFSAKMMDDLRNKTMPGSHRFHGLDRISLVAVIVGAELNADLERQTIRNTTTGMARPLSERGAYVPDTVGVA